MLNANDRGTTFCLVIAILTIWDLPHRKSRGIRMLYKSKNLQQPRFLCHQPIVHSLLECTAITRHGFEASLSIEYVISITYEYLFIAYQCLAVLDLVV